MVSAPKIFDFMGYYKSDFRIARAVALWINDGQKKPKLYIVYYIFINIFLVFSFNVSLLVYLCQTVRDLKSLADFGYIIATSFVAMTKSFFIWRNREFFKKLYLSLDDDVFQPRYKSQIPIILQALQVYRAIKNTFLVVGFFATLTSVVNPLFFKKEGENLPFGGAYPMDLYIPLNYAIAYIHQIIAIYYVTFFNVYSEILFGSFSTFVGLQCDILCSNLRDHDTDQTSIEEYVTHHWKIMSFAKTAGAIFNEIYFLLFTQSVMSFCITFFLLTLVEPNSFKFFYLCIYQFATFGMLFIPCWFATEATKKSENIPNAAYESPWADTSKSFEKDLVFFIHMSQKPFHFYAINFFKVSVDTFVKILRTSYSFFAVLNTLNTGETY